MSEIMILNFKDPRILLRDYEAQVVQIFFESSAKKEFKDQAERETFQWKYLGFYLAHYPEYAWIAVLGEVVLGYVIGMPFTQDPSLYAIQPHLKPFEDLFKDYPGHLHINCHFESRGKGVGGQLVQTFIQQLKGEGVKGLHIMTGPAALNRSFYYKLGFDYEVERNQILFMGKSLNS